jgi:hypothetical protein
MKTQMDQSVQAMHSTGKSQQIRHGGLKQTGPNEFQDDRYTFSFQRGELKIYDRQSQTYVRTWGDPHVWTGDGDKLGFHQDNLTIDLQNGTKVTLTPTEKNAAGVALLDEVAIMTEGGAALISDISGKGPTVSRFDGDAAGVDALHEDGTVLRAGLEVDDLFAWIEDQWKQIEGGGKRGGDFGLDGLGGRSRISFRDRVEQSGSDSASVQDVIYGEIKGVQEEIDGLMAKLKATKDPDERQNLVNQMQSLMQMKRMLWEMLTNISRSEHETRMAVVRNLRV